MPEMFFLTSQIKELHRLYRRQRELMYELKRDELHKPDRRYEVSCSKTAMCQSSSKYSQKTIQVFSLPFISPLDTQMSVSGPESIQAPSSLVQGKSVQACPYPAKPEGCFKDFHAMEIKCKKFGNKILDLQLPAEEYIDNEERELAENEEISEVPETSSYPLQISQVMSKSDVKPVSGSNGFVFHDNTVSPASMLKKLNGLTLEEEVAPVFSERELQCCELSGKRQSGFQVLSKEFFQNTNTKWDIEACSSLLPSEIEIKEHLSSNDEAGENLITKQHYFPSFFLFKFNITCFSLRRLMLLF